MKSMIIAAGLLLTLPAHSATPVSATPCSASQDVANLASLVSTIFNGDEIVCDNGNTFVSSMEYECRGDRYVQIKDPNETGTDRHGNTVFWVNELGVVDGQVVAMEVVYESGEAYINGEKPIEITTSKFNQLSPKSLFFYSGEDAATDNWISSTWMIQENGDLLGYKLYADEMTTCRRARQQANH